MNKNKSIAIEDNRMDQLADVIKRHTSDEYLNQTAIPGLRFLKVSNPEHSLPEFNNPFLCLIVQGGKSVMIGDAVYSYQKGEYLLFALNMPFVGIVAEASAKAPFYCLHLDIDMPLIAELLMDERLRIDFTKDTTTTGVYLDKADDNLSDALFRLVSLLDTLREAAFLAPMYIREIHYRLLRSEQGRQLASLSMPSSNIRKIGRVITYIKENFQDPLRMDDLASIAGMSVSSFHQHFKRFTISTPLQFQKQLRLMEARRLMATENIDATAAAFKVGYQSLSQFSREYHRMFGNSPSRDIKIIRDSALGNALRNNKGLA